MYLEYNIALRVLYDISTIFHKIDDILRCSISRYSKTVHEIPWFPFNLVEHMYDSARTTTARDVSLASL